MSIFQKIKEFFIKPEFHPEAHDEQVAKIIEDILQHGLKKGSKKSAVEIQAVSGQERDSFRSMVEPLVTAMLKPGEYETVAQNSDRLNMGLDSDSKQRLRLPKNSIDSLASMLFLENQGHLNGEEISDSLNKIYNTHFILPTHSEQLSLVINKISEKGLKKGLKNLNNEIGYLARKTVDSFVKEVSPKIEPFTQNANEEIIPTATYYLGLQLDDDERVRFRLEENAMEAFVALIELEKMTPVTDDEEDQAMREIFRHYTFTPTHDKQVQKLIRDICNSGLKNGSKKSAEEIKYLTGMSVEEFIDYVKDDVQAAHQYDISGMLAGASDMLGMNLDDDEKWRIHLPDDAIDGFATLGVLSQNDFLWDGEEELALKEVFDHHSIETDEEEE